MPQCCVKCLLVVVTFLSVTCVSQFSTDLPSTLSIRRAAPQPPVLHEEEVGTVTLKQVHEHSGSDAGSESFDNVRGSLALSQAIQKEDNPKEDTHEKSASLLKPEPAKPDTPENSTAGKPQTTDLKPCGLLDLPHAKITEIQPFFHSITGTICLHSNKGEVLLVGNGNESLPLVREDRLDDYPFRAQWIRPGHIPAEAEVVQGRVLWVFNSFGRQNHFGHWVLYFAVAYLTALNEHLTAAERELLDVTVTELKKGYVNQFSSVLVPNANVHLVPNKTVCYTKAYAGIPSWENTVWSATPDPLFDVKGHIYYHELRKRLWQYDNRVYGALATPQGRGDRLRLALTYRRKPAPGSFGRNITNIDVLVEGLQNHTDFQSVEPIPVDWVDYPMAEQFKLARSLDMIFGCHGNNLIWQLVMRPESVILEVFPHGMRLNITGVNIGMANRHRPHLTDIIRKEQFMPYIGSRLNHTHVLWVSQNRNNSELAPRSEWKRLDTHALHVCKGQSKTSWKCAHLEMPPRIFFAMVRTGMESVDQYTGEMWPGEGYLNKTIVCGSLHYYPSSISPPSHTEHA